MVTQTMVCCELMKKEVQNKVQAQQLLAHTHKMT